MKKYFALFIVLSLLVMGMVLYQIFNDEDSPSNKTLMNEDLVEEPIPLPTLPDEINTTLIDTASKFLEAYISYSSEEPTVYLERMKPTVTSSFFESHMQNPKREPLDVLAYTWDKGSSEITVMNPIEETEVTKQKYTVYAEVSRIKTGKDGESEQMKDYLLELILIDGNWKVSEVDVQDGKQYKSSE